MRLRPLVLAAACVVGAGGLMVAFGAGARPRQQPVASLASRTDTFIRPGKVDVGDVVRVTLFGLYAAGAHDALDVHVAEDGTIALPKIGQVQVKGLTTDRAAANIAMAEAREQLQNDAIVVVGIIRTAAESRVRPGAIAVGENLRISLFDISGPNDRLEVLAQVAEDGTIVLPAAGAVKVGGLTELTAHDAIKKAFSDKQVIENATVSVLRLDAAGVP